MSLPEPIAVCIEDLDAPDPAAQYTRCVAVPGGMPGLGVTAGGELVWEHAELTGCELWVSVDDRLILWRPVGAERIVVRRAGRSLEVPQEKPVVLVDQDQFDVASRRFRIHVHGRAPSVHPPTPFRTRAMGAAATLAAAVALGGVTEGCEKQQDDIEVRDQPPAAPVLLPDGSAPEGGKHAAADPSASASATAAAVAEGSTKPDAAAPAATPTSKKPPPIEVRDRPPAPPRQDPGGKPTL